ncbi:MAG: UDP-N-acetylmuramoyl-L-alanine--D-glutamate ligase [Pyramidobacter sp.]|nr:UDP-N-acetylmuramoyl-L-alanine--D-glutamate ligase [Pyramidobacter sp.]
MTGRICVVGGGVSGRSLALWAKKLGASVLVSDTAALSDETQRLFEKNGIAWECGGHIAACQCDMMVLSSGISPKSEAVAAARRMGIPVVGELDFLAPYLSGKIIAVTGTNGKTTSTALAAHVLQSNGLRVQAAGNIGVPLADCAGKKYDALVLELSSFQLHWSSVLKPDAAILTNLASDHLDWHGSYENYISDKCHIFAPPEDRKSWAVVHSRDAFRVPPPREVWTLSGGQRRIEFAGGAAELVCESGSRVLFHRDRLRLQGTHNVENAAMALAAAVLVFPHIDPSAGLETFQPPRHRCEFIRTYRGAVYIDDSKGTNVAASVTALRCIDGAKVVILGGQGKGEDYAELARAVREQARATIVLGEEADAIMQALAHAGFTEVCRAGSMEDAVKKAASIACPGDTVLLSPACTSWDMYKNYAERGEHFAAIVRSLD